jgi:hypothetical protein
MLRSIVARSLILSPFPRIGKSLTITDSTPTVRRWLACGTATEVHEIIENSPIRARWWMSRPDLS